MLFFRDFAAVLQTKNSTRNMSSIILVATEKTDISREETIYAPLSVTVSRK